MTFRMAARVIRIMCASTTSTSTITGRATACSLSQKDMPGKTMATGWKTGISCVSRKDDE